jgi:hypothetical protein
LGKRRLQARAHHRRTRRRDKRPLLRRSTHSVARLAHHVLARISRSVICWSPPASCGISLQACQGESQDSPASPRHLETGDGASSCFSPVCGTMKAWGRMESCGGLQTRPERRLSTAEQPDELAHNRTVPGARSPWCTASFGQVAQNSTRNKGLSPEITPDFGQPAQN